MIFLMNDFVYSRIPLQSNSEKLFPTFRILQSEFLNSLYSLLITLYSLLFYQQKSHPLFLRMASFLLSSFYKHTTLSSASGEEECQ